MNRLRASCGEADSKSRPRSKQILAEGGGYRRPAAAILIISFIVMATIGAFALGEPDDSAGTDTDTVGDEQKCGANLTWALEGGTLTISGTGVMYDYGETNPAPWTAGAVNSVVFSVEDMTNIGTYAFKGCISMSKITIPGCVEKIGANAFQGCTGLTEVDLNQVKTIEADVFTSAFKDGETVKIVLPDSVEKIGNFAFSLSKLTSITIPSSVKTIGQGAFQFCDCLSTVTFGDSITIAAIEKDTFWECTSLRSIDIPSSVETIGEGAFQFCGCLSTVTFGDSITIAAIKKDTFLKCTSLESIDIPSSVETIEYKAFAESGLTEITIPEKVASIEGRAFADCTALTKIEVEQENKNYFSINGVLFERNGDNKNTLVQYPAGNEGKKYTIPYQATAIGQYAFSKCTKLIDITILNSVDTIGEGAFYACKGLTKIDIPDSVGTIGTKAFYECTGLKTVIFGKGITNVGDSVFGTGSTETKFNVFGGGEAYFNSKAKLVDFNGGEFTYNSSKDALSMVIQRIIGGVIYEIDEFGTGTNTAAVKGHEAIDLGDVEICNQIEIGHFIYSVTSIKKEAFKECKTLTSVTILASFPWDGSGSNPFGDYAFCKCENLRNVTISGNINTISTGAFAECTKLGSVITTGGGSVKTIGEGAFSMCTSLSSITIPDSVETISTAAFGGCSSLKTIEFGTGSKLKTIDTSAFAMCTSLSSITIPDSVETIGKWAFGGCSGLKAIVFGTEKSGLSTIAEDAFGEVIDPSATVPTIVPTKFYDESGSMITVTADAVKGKTFTGDIYVMYIDVFGTHFWKGVIYKYDASGEARVSGFIDGIIENEVMILDAFTAHDTSCRVISISDGAFKGCTALTSVTIPDSVETIGEKAFGGCDNLKTIHFGNGITEIADDAFCDSNGKSTKFNDELSKQISTSSDIAKFRGQTFTGSISEMTIKTLGTRTYDGVIYVVPVSGEAYVYGCTDDIKSETTILDSITIDGVTYKVVSIAAGAFEDCTKLTSITIPDSVKDIKEYAFLNCTSLEIVSFGTGIETVDPNAFSTGKRGGDIDKTVFYDENHDPIDISAQTEKLRGNLFKGDIYEMALAHTITIDDGTSSRTYIGCVGDKISRPADPTRDGYKFLYWADEDGNEFDWIIPAKDVKVTAVWKAVSPSGDDDDNPPYNPSDNGSGSTDGSDGNDSGSTILIIVACIAAFMAVLAAYVCSNKR